MGLKANLARKTKLTRLLNHPDYTSNSDHWKNMFETHPFLVDEFYDNLRLDTQYRKKRRSGAWLDNVEAVPEIDVPKARRASAERIGIYSLLTHPHFEEQGLRIASSSTYWSLLFSQPQNSETLPLTAASFRRGAFALTIWSEVQAAKQIYKTLLEYLGPQFLSCFDKEWAQGSTLELNRAVSFSGLFKGPTKTYHSPERGKAAVAPNRPVSIFLAGSFRSRKFGDDTLIGVNIELLDPVARKIIAQNSPGRAVPKLSYRLIAQILKRTNETSIRDTCRRVKRCAKQLGVKLPPQKNII